MASLEDALSLAVSHQQAGRFSEAKAICDRILAVLPNHPPTLHLSGTMELAFGAPNQAITLFQAAIEHGGPDVACFLDLARAQGLCGKLKEAEANLRKAIRLQPNSAEVLYNAGFIYRLHGNTRESASVLERAIRLRSVFPEALSEWGMALHAEGRNAEAIQKCQLAISHNPQFVRGHMNLGGLLLADHNAEKAAEHFQRAIELQPDHAPAYINLGRAEHSRRHFDNATALFRHALMLEPTNAEAHINMGLSLRMMQRFAEAVECFKCALLIRPTMAEAYNGLGIVADAQGLHDEALTQLRRATLLNPSFAGAHWNQASLLFRRGHFAAGWSKYEWRWLTPDFHAKPRPFKQKQWQGEYSEKPVLVWAEQGLGDEILYASMISDLLEKGQRVIFECDERLVALFQRTWPTITVVARVTPPHTETEQATHQIALASLGRLMRDQSDKFSRTPGYLKPDPEKVRSLQATQRAANSSTSRLTIGFSWISKNVDFEDRKSIPLTHWKPILTQQGIQFVDLQYGDASAELEECRRQTGALIHHPYEIDVTNDIDGLAALVAGCDLVITVSNVTAHMAGALGVPVWIIIPAGYSQLPYWFSEQETPWYPSARLFRQKKSGDWKPVMAEIFEELRKLGSN